MSIQILSDLVVAQIAAGEVVERPASVVKELIENSLDSGASYIQVSIGGGGQRLLRVSDNGSGILAAEVELAFASHATSKLRIADDLNHLVTLGFRGEALCSIAAVSQLTCITRHQSESHGTKLSIEGGDITSRQSIGAPAGTIITVENLFYNVPARLKFLKKDATEKRQITQIVTLMAMAYPNVRFMLELDGREAFRSPGTGLLSDVLVAAYGVDDIKQMVPVDAVTGGIRVSGFTSGADLWRTDRNRISVFVNGRVVQDNNLTYAVTQAYQTLFQVGQYPVAALMIQLLPEDVDVNVHPTKAEVRFREPSTVFMAVQRAVREAVIATSAGAGSLPVQPRALEGSTLFRPQQTRSVLQDAAGANTESSAALPPMPTHSDETYDHIPEGAGVPENPRTLPVLRVVGQVGARYVIAEGPAGVYLIDQHNAHSRVLYGRLAAQLAAGTLAKTAAISGTASLPPAQARLLEQAYPILAMVGIEFEAFGPNTFRILSAPSILEGLDADTILHALIPELSRDDPQEAILRGVCRIAAVKSGQMLNPEQMQALVRQLERTQEPFTSPDGSPTILHLSSDQLIREFKSR